jgi:HD superfamily phosphohydrolase
MAASRFKLFSDPVHGFVSVPRGLVLDLVQTPEMQRLRRIRQLGVGYLVFPGAEHSRFGHALGAMALMHEALAVLSEKGTDISPEESTAALCAALLHDIGHGPFSHTLETELIQDFEHENMSRVLIEHLALQFGAPLDLALRIFDGAYERPFFHQLVSSQLDMDRLDYLRRDSFYTGVVEGSVGVERILKTMQVHPLDGGIDSRIVIESKGIYAVESFLIARRLMYWQVYLHKTVIAGDIVLRAIIRRARRLIGDGDVADRCSPAFRFFLENEITANDVANPSVWNVYCQLDDADVLYSIKQWRTANDRILADLSRRFLERDFFRIVFLDNAISKDALESCRMAVEDWLVRTGLCDEEHASREVSYFLRADFSEHATYETFAESIHVIDQGGIVRELSEITDGARLWNAGLDGERQTERLSSSAGWTWVIRVSMSRIQATASMRSRAIRSAPTGYTGPSRH